MKKMWWCFWIEGCVFYYEEEGGVKVERDDDRRGIFFWRGSIAVIL